MRISVYVVGAQRGRFMQRLTSVARYSLAAVTGALMMATSARGQATARLSGRVTDRSTGDPVRGARVAVVNSSLFSVTDSLGAFSLAPMPVGASQLVVRSEHYPALRFAVELSLGQH